MRIVWTMPDLRQVMVSYGLFEGKVDMKNREEVRIHLDAKVFKEIDCGDKR